ncbi:unnamed protein product [Oppiella nova]|uniref:Uncharacterized protein n=1 Tax=Oppiella nova TaxID=334625 RepID=A0A7R9LNU9_9ACAR|nr:unnamed protein product [Oppiella nova]CAG2164896.1 unnamed protein product [Oppiella nova]
MFSAGRSQYATELNDPGDANVCIATMFEDTVCSPEDGQAFEKVCGKIEVTEGSTTYSLPDCTKHGYGVDMSRDICKF